MFQVLVLRDRRAPRGAPAIIVVNTHLIMHTIAAALRSLQLLMVLREVRRWQQSVALSDHSQSDESQRKQQQQQQPKRHSQSVAEASVAATVPSTSALSPTVPLTTALSPTAAQTPKTHSHTTQPTKSHPPNPQPNAKPTKPHPSNPQPYSHPPNPQPYSHPPNSQPCGVGSASVAVATAPVTPTTTTSTTPLPKSGSADPGHSPTYAAEISSASVLLCGDLNIRTMGESALSLMEHAKVSASHYDWVVGRNYNKKGYHVRSFQTKASRQEFSGLTGTVCGASIGVAGTCPLVSMGAGQRCWDHTCAACGGEKENKQRHCERCASKPLPSAYRWQPPPQPYLNVSLQNPFGVWCHGYEAARHHKGKAGAWSGGGKVLFVSPFHVVTGMLFPKPLPELKDHCWCYNHPRARVLGRHLTAVDCVEVPADLSFIRGIPNLSWPSDHMALVIDLEWA